MASRSAGVDRRLGVGGRAAGAVKGKLSQTPDGQARIRATHAGLTARSARRRGDLASLDVIVESGKHGFEAGVPFAAHGDYIERPIWVRRGRPAAWWSV